MAGQEKIRINKVLKEFNIGLGTLVEFLSRKGFEVEANPGAQISGEEYELVKKEYAKEQLIKEESKKISIKVKEITKRESSRQEPEEEPFGDEVIIKTTTIGHPSTPEPAITEKNTESHDQIEKPNNPAAGNIQDRPAEHALTREPEPERETEKIVEPAEPTRNLNLSMLPLLPLTVRRQLPEYAMLRSSQPLSIRIIREASRFWAKSSLTEASPRTRPQTGKRVPAPEPQTCRQSLLPLYVTKPAHSKNTRRTQGKSREHRDQSGETGRTGHQRKDRSVSVREEA